MRDSLVCSRLLWPDIGDSDSKRVGGDKFFPPAQVGSHSLEAWGHRLGVLKGSLDYENQDFSKWTKELQEQCEQDVEVTAALVKLILSKGYSEEAIQLEHDFAEIIQLQEDFGFRFDETAAGELYAKLAGRRAELEGRLQEVFKPTVETLKTPAYWTGKVASGVPYEPWETRQFPTKAAALKEKAQGVLKGPLKTREIPFNPGSRLQAAERLSKLGWKPKQTTPTGQPCVDEGALLGWEHIPECAILLEYLCTQKMIGQLAEGDNAWLKLVKNGRIHGRVNTCGAITRRCTHSKPNMGQIPAVRKDKQKKTLMGYEGGWGFESRSLFIPDPGYSLVGYDASGIQLRIFAHYLAKYDGGAYAKIVISGDIHTHNQKLFEADTRDQSKTLIYAKLFGAWYKRLGEIAGGDEKRGKKISDTFSKNLPAFAYLERDIKAAVRAKGYLRGLDGGTIQIRSEHSALNALIQYAEAVIMKKAAVLHKHKMESLGWTHGNQWAKLADIHDESQGQVLKGLEETYGGLAVESLRESGEHFRMRCPITGEYRVGKSWAETH